MIKKGIDTFGIGIDKFDVELMKWNWPHVWSVYISTCTCIYLDDDVDGCGDDNDDDKDADDDDKDDGG